MRDDADPSLELLLDSFDDVELPLFGFELRSVFAVSDLLDLGGHGHAVPHADEQPDVLGDHHELCVEPSQLDQVLRRHVAALLLLQPQEPTDQVELRQLVLIARSRRHARRQLVGVPERRCHPLHLRDRVTLVSRFQVRSRRRGRVRRQVGSRLAVRAWQASRLRHRLVREQARPLNNCRNRQRTGWPPVEKMLLLQYRVEILDLAHVINLIAQTLRLRWRG